MSATCVMQQLLAAGIGTQFETFYTFSLLYSQNNGIYNVCVDFYLCWSSTCCEHLLEIRWGEKRDKEKKKETKKIEKASCISA